jgi:aminoglycoside phosphotransferase (APT) family kinase protein
VFGEGGCCFVAGTPVETGEGLKRIEDIHVGDLVRAREAKTGATSLKPVVRLFRRHNRQIFDVKLATADGRSEVIGTSAGHPFHVRNLGWLVASKLVPGEIVDQLDGEGGRVVSVEREKTLQDTYNFEVAEAHTYFVGRSHAWVHNASICTTLPSTATTELPLVYEPTPSLPVVYQTPSLAPTLPVNVLPNGIGIIDALPLTASQARGMTVTGSTAAGQPILTGGAIKYVLGADGRAYPVTPGLDPALVGSNVPAGLLSKPELPNGYDWTNNFIDIPNFGLQQLISGPDKGPMVLAGVMGNGATDPYVPGALVFQRATNGQLTSDYFTVGAKGTQVDVRRLDSAGNTNTGVDWIIPPVSDQAQINRQVHDTAVTSIVQDLVGQGAQVQTSVSMRGPGTPAAVADLVVTGNPDGVLLVPEGFHAYNRDGHLLNAIPLSPQGKGILEVKTGGGEETPGHQDVVYPCCELGTAEGFGPNAAAAGISGPFPQTPVTILRPVEEAPNNSAGGALQTPSPAQIEALKPQIEALHTDQGRIDPAAMTKFLEGLPALKSGSPEDLKTFAAKAFGVPSESLGIRPVWKEGEIGAKGGSGAPVWLVQGPNGGLQGVVKVFPATQQQLSVMGEELHAMQKLNELHPQQFQSIEVLGAARLPDGAGAIVLSPARGTATDDLMIRLSKTQAGTPEYEAAMRDLQEAMRANGAALAELHSVRDGLGVPQAPALDDYIKAAAEITGKINDRISRLPAEDRKMLNLNPVELQKRVQSLIEGVRRNPGTSSLTHDDFHPGNVFYDKQAGITFIDNGRVSQSLGAENSTIGSPARDFAHFDQKLAGFGWEFGMREQDVNALRQTFRQAYTANAPALTPESEQFFTARTALGIFLGALDNQMAKVASPPDSPTFTPEWAAAQTRMLKKALGLK